MISHMVSITRIRVRIGRDTGKVRVRVSRASFRVRVSASRSLLWLIWEAVTSSIYATHLEENIVEICDGVCGVDNICAGRCTL